jgi:hypothetical protein
MATRNTFSKDGFGRALKQFYAYLDAVPNTLQGYENVVTKAGATALDPSVYNSKIVTGGTQGNEPVTLADGTYVGQRKLITEVTRTHASDVVVLPFAKILNVSGTQATAATMTNTGFIMLEWTGAKWHAKYLSNVTITTE